MYAVLVSILVAGQVPALQGVEKGSVDAARAAYANSQASKVDPNSKRVGKAIAHGLKDVPKIDGMLSRSLATGQWGTWPSQFEVVQVIDETRMLATYYYDPSIRVLMLRGFSTADLADGDKFVLAELAKVNGTATFTTVTGAKKTVQVLEPLSKEDLAKKGAAGVVEVKDPAAAKPEVPAANPAVVDPPATKPPMTKPPVKKKAPAKKKAAKKPAK